MEEKIIIYLGDVRELIPKMSIKFNRVVMPLPKSSEDFLDLALLKTKKNGMIHLYTFLHEKEINKEAKKISQLCKNLKHPVRIIRKVKCGQFSPGTFRVCFDIKKL